MPLGPADQRVLLLRTPLADGRHRFGTGTLIADRLALTAAHAVFGDDGAPLRGVRIGQANGTGPPDWSGLRQGVVVWPRRIERNSLPSRGLDLALVEITDSEWEYPRGLSEQVYFGTLTSRASGVAVDAIGYPRVLRESDGERIADHVSATINPSAARHAGRYELNVTSSSPIADDSWGGLSGAGVFADGLLVAVIVVDSEGYAHSRLSAVPVRRLVRANDAELILRQHGFECGIQSVELKHLMHFVRPVRRAQESYRSPATLLRAEAQIVEFFGRDTVMDQLTDWCADERRLVDVSLIIGPGGQGKTRLARELAMYHEKRDWISGFLRLGPELNLAPIADTASHVPGILLIVDYAETRFAQISRLLTLLAESADLAPVRILLLARSAGEWWSELRRRHPSALGGTVPIPLGGLAPVLGELAPFEARAYAFEKALLSYVAEEALPSVYPDHDWHAIAKAIALPVDFDKPAYNSPLTVQLIALTSLLRRAQIIAEDGFDAPEEQLLAHEEFYWKDMADAAGLPFSAPYQRRLLSYFVAAANLFGAKTEDDAFRLIARLPTWNKDQEAARGVAEWLHGLYPPDDEREYWGSLQPDRLAEYHLRSLAKQRQDLLLSLFGNASTDEARHAVPLLTRATKLHDELTSQLEKLLGIEQLLCRAALSDVVGEIARLEEQEAEQETRQEVKIRVHWEGVPLAQLENDNLDISHQYIDYATTPSLGGSSGTPSLRILRDFP